MPGRFHLVDSEAQKEQCPCCGVDVSDVNGWKSEFHIDMHYKELKCNCGYKLSVKVDFMGSGHDDWDGKPSWKDSEELDRLVEEEHSQLTDIETEEDD